MWIYYQHLLKRKNSVQKSWHRNLIGIFTRAPRLPLRTARCILQGVIVGEWVKTSGVCPQVLKRELRSARIQWFSGAMFTAPSQVWPNSFWRFTCSGEVRNSRKIIENSHIVNFTKHLWRGETCVLAHIVGRLLRAVVNFYCY